MFAQKKYADATAAQIRDYAINFLQLEVKPTATESDILALVQSAQPGQEFIFVTYEEPAALQEVGADVSAFDIPDVRVDDNARGKGTLGQRDPRCIIMIPATDTPDGQLAVEVGVNGMCWQLKRGVDLDIPLRVFMNLMNTEQEIIRHDPDNDDVITTKALRFPIQVRSAPSAEEIAKWEQEMSGQFCP